jgi:hypothetical protein
LVYELIEGVSLGHEMQSGSLDLNHALDLLSDVAEALDALHAVGLLHRDVKPENVMIEPSGRARLIDLGLLRPDSQGQTLTATGMLLGTPEYMAPESFSDTKGDPAQDRYAFGCLAYHLLAGRPPFVGDLHQVLRGHLKEPVPRLPGGLLERHPGYQGIMESILAKQAQVRPKSCLAVVEALRGGSETATFPSRGAPTVLLPEGGTVATPGVTARILRSRRFRHLAATLGILGFFGALLWNGPSSTSPPQAPGPEVTPPVGTGTVLSSVEAARKLREDLVAEYRALGDIWVDSEGRILGEEEDLAKVGAQNLLEPDPALCDIRRRLLPVLAQCMEILQQGGPPENLSLDYRNELMRMDSWLLKQGHERIFHPVLEARPNPVPTAYPDAILEAARIEDVEEMLRNQGQMRGWQRTSFEAATEAIGGYKKMEEEFNEDPEGFLGEDFRPVLDRARGYSSRSSLWFILRNQGGILTYRIRIYRRIRIVGEKLRVALYAGLRSIEAEPETGELVSLLLRRVSRDLKGLQAIFLLPVEPGSQLLWRAKSPAAAMLLAANLNLQAGLRLHWKLPRRELLEVEEKVLGRALGGEGRGFPERERLCMAWEWLTELLLRKKKYAQVADLYRKWWSVLKVEGYLGLALTLEKLVEASLRNGAELGLSQEERRTLADRMQARVKDLQKEEPTLYRRMLKALPRLRH